MILSEEKLSAFLDGELPEAEARAVQEALATDPEMQATLEALMAADTLAKDAFEEMGEEPVPLALAAAIQDAPVAAAPANLSEPPARARWLAAVATVLALMIGLGAGYLGGLNQSQQVAVAPGWLEDIADYHRVYAGQKRHLVEVGADEADHIQTWLTNTVGAQVLIPDLAAEGLEFRGARLLVAAGKPVAQLMYTDPEGAVVALCLIQSETPRDGFATRSINAFEMVSWGGTDANFVIVGDEGREDLQAIAEAAASQV
jgi:anti-sigma factor RsiW